MNPLVSCIMPTWNRRPYIKAAIQCFLDQDYEPRELVIIDDGDDRIRDLVPADDRIRYIELDKRVSTGRKRNLCCDKAMGEIICHFDDDDWSAPERIADQIQRMQSTGKSVTGYSAILFWDRVIKKAKQYRSRVIGYVCGTSLCYSRDDWKARPFPDKQMSSDNHFVNADLRRIATADGSKLLVARIHNCHHTSPKHGIRDIVQTSRIPEAFWANEKLIS